VPVTTRNWNTIVAIVRILQTRAERGKGDCDAEDIQCLESPWRPA
jgi:hypothetical protein